MRPPIPLVQAGAHASLCRQRLFAEADDFAIIYRRGQSRAVNTVRLGTVARGKRDLPARVVKPPYAYRVGLSSKEG
jgi:hypothetical protein